MKLFFKITIVVVCIVFFACKKQFDKDYYKDCVGDDSVVSNNANLVKPDMIDYFFQNDTANAYKIIKRNNFEPTILSDSLAEKLRDVFKQKFANRLIDEGIKDIVNIDTTKQMILVCFFYELSTRNSRAQVCSSNFNIIINKNNSLFIENNIITPFENPNSGDEYLIGIIGILVINENYNNEKLVLNEKYFKCD